jgi:hypothetical protein
MVTAVDSMPFAVVMKVVKEEGRTSVLGTSAHPSCLVLVPGRVHVHAGSHCLRHANMRQYSAVAPSGQEEEDQPQRPRLQDPASIVAPNRNRVPGYGTGDDLACRCVLARSNGQSTAQGHDVSFLDEGAGYGAADRTIRQRGPTRHQPNHVLPLQAVGQHGMF